MKRKKTKKYSFVGKFFHSVNSEGCIRWQGYIEAEVKKNLFLVNTFDWVMGDLCPEKMLISLDEMKDWLFYESNEDMKFSYEYGAAGKMTKKAKEEEKKLSV